MLSPNVQSLPETPAFQVFWASIPRGTWRRQWSPVPYGEELNKILALARQIHAQMVKEGEPCMGMQGIQASLVGKDHQGFKVDAAPTNA